MQVLESQIDTSGEEFQANKAYMEAYVDKVRQVERNQLKTELAYRPKARKKGKLLPRGRLALLLDPGTPFVHVLEEHHGVVHFFLGLVVHPVSHALEGLGLEVS